MVSSSQIDRLGDRLRFGQFTDDDLRELDAYRQSFVGAYEAVISSIRQELGLKPTGRPAKSTTSIVDKLRRESIRLSQIQDIAGARVVVENLQVQDQVIADFVRLFPLASIVDRRAAPSHAYRAVHLVVQVSGRTIEVQLRSRLQHVWAEVSEGLSVVFGVNLKYGGGPPEVRRLLESASRSIAMAEGLNTKIALLGEQRAVLEEQLVSILRLIANLKPSHHWSADDISS